MASNSVKPDGREAQGNAEPSPTYREGVETRRRPPSGLLVHGEGIVQGVQKWAQTGILWSLVQVQHGLPLLFCSGRSLPQGGDVAALFKQKRSSSKLHRILSASRSRSCPFQPAMLCPSPRLAPIFLNWPTRLRRGQ